ncbi:MAG TPA: outer membrane protein assembly factor BamD [Saprospiraceae bacterium]|nr:outer membrane protein assembly factor BamD [Saprospiraceae bacterium]HMP13776.1 outer membrane protein assembly factor BamD [Saprospiraceae bacterium]
MKDNRFIVWSSILFLLALTACKSEFERIRASGDAELLYKKANEYYEKEQYQRAQTLYELVLSSFRGRKEAEDIYFRYANTYYQLQQYILGAYYYKNFSQTYTSSPLREEADFMSAYCNYKLSPVFRLDQSYSLKAIEELQLFVNTYPRSERVAECNRLIDEMRAKLERKAYDEGQLYFNLRMYQAATKVFENLLRDFPETRNVEQVRYMIVRSAYLLAENSVVSRQQERYEEALEKTNRFLARFPNGRYTKEINGYKIVSQRKLNQFNNVGYQN